MKNQYQIRMVEASDLNELHRHFIRHGKESGKEKGLIFTPFEEEWSKPIEAFKVEKIKLYSTPLTAEGWQRDWGIFDHDEIFGHLTLNHHIGIKCSLHRALLMMGIEECFRGHGLGKELIKSAIQWAKNQKSLSWINLNVFSHNERARKLYHEMGFKEVGINEDLFRVSGVSISDIEMTMKL